MKYVRNEWMKLWSKKGTWVMVALLALVIIGYTVTTKVYEVRNNAEETWQQDVKEGIAMQKQWIEEGDESLVENVAIMQYQLDNNISSGYVTTFSDAVSFGSSMIVLVTVFAVIIAAVAAVLVFIVIVSSLL